MRHERRARASPQRHIRRHKSRTLPPLPNLGGKLLYPPHDPALPVVAIDFDGVLASNVWPSPKIGEADLAALDLVEHYYAAGCEVIVFTARPESHHARIRAWLELHGLGGLVYEVTNRKPVACLYFDDRAVRWPLGA